MPKSYADSTLSGLTRTFGLALDETTDLLADVPEANLRSEFHSRIELTLPLAIGTSTEKARSGSIIAPILSELWLLSERKIGVLSGVDFSVDPAQGLAGVCDYIVTRSPEQLLVDAPVLMVVEAKNEDMKRGYPQCVAEMVAAQRFNVRESEECGPIYGAVTTGELWKFLKLDGGTVWIDLRGYHIDRLAKIMGILQKLVQ